MPNSTAATIGMLNSGSMPSVPEQHQRQEHAHHHDLAMGEIDDADDAEDDRQAERAQAVDQAGQQAADGDVE